MANKKSSIILGRKFNDEFISALKKLTKMNHSPLEIESELSYTEFRNTLFCLGFIQTLESMQSEASQLSSLWKLLNECNGVTNEAMITTKNKVKTLGLYNFLSYLQSIELLVDYEYLEKQR